MSTIHCQFYLNGDCLADSKLEKPPRLGERVVLMHEGESKQFVIDGLLQHYHSSVLVITLKAKP